MMSRHAQENLVSVLLLAVFACVIALCQDFGPRARMIPLPLAIFGIVLTLIQLAWHNLGSPETLQMDMIEVRAPDASEPEPVTTPVEKPSWLREIAAFAMVLGLIAMVFAVGMMPAAFLFTAGYFLLTRYCSWWRSLLYGGLLTAAVYLLFEVALEMQPYHGLLAPLFQ